MRKILTKQHNDSDCGPACIVSVAAHYNLQLALAKVRELAETNEKGTNLMGMIKSAQKLGFEAKGVRAEFSNLFEIPKPTIAHIILERRLQHYVVVYDCNKNYVKIMDPSTGTIKMKTNYEFRKEWTGILIIILPIKFFKKVMTKFLLTGAFVRD